MNLITTTYITTFNKGFCKIRKNNIEIIIVQLTFRNYELINNSMKGNISYFIRNQHNR